MCVCDKREGGRNEKETSVFHEKKKMKKRPPYSTKKCFSVFPLLEVEGVEEQEEWHDFEDPPNLEVELPNLEDDLEYAVFEV